jgi:hypothetical protein
MLCCRELQAALAEEDVCLRRRQQQEEAFERAFASLNATVALLAATGAAGAEAADKLAQEKRLLCVKGHELEVGRDILLLG